MATVMVVEDNRTTARGIRNTVEGLGYTVIPDEIASGEEAIKMAKKMKPDLVLMDMQLQGDKKGEMSGISAAEEIKTSRNIPIVYLTAYADLETLQRAKVTEPFGYLLKPFDKRELHVAIEMALYTHQKEIELRESNRKLEETLAELRETQQQVIRRERLRVLGQMAQGIAHSLMSTMTGIVGLSHILRDRLERINPGGKDDFLNLLASITDSAGHATDVVRSLRAFYRSRKEDEVFHPVSLNKLIREALGMTQPMLEGLEGDAHVLINVVTEFEDVSDVSGMASDLIDLLISLISNAVEAMPEGGTLTLRTMCIGDEQVELSISDTGIGMDKDTVEHCLEPYFTGKYGSGGTGLGLAITQGIVNRHVGKIDIESMPGKGTTIRICLPVYKAQEEATEVMGPLHVLVVDNDPAAVEKVCAFLTEDTHTFKTATDGQAGMELFRSERFDLIITEFELPKITGYELAVAIKHIADKPVMMLTEYAEMITGTGEMPDGVRLVVSKPITRKKLRAALTQVMA